MRFAKGHGTGNDFVLLPDPDGALDLTPELVRRLCDRRYGIGGDGVIRVVRSAKHPDAVHLAGEAAWFMDYHNADGSLSEMCGNGIRVFARYLTETGLVEAAVFPVATRTGPVLALVGEDSITVDMPNAVIGPPSRARHRQSGRDFPGTAVTVGNPHLVCPVDDVADLDLSVAPGVDPVLFPDGANVEFVADAEPLDHADLDRHVRMRVYERGVGETMSCGSGACAVAAVAVREMGLNVGTVAVDLPGGRLTVAIAIDRCILSGPAEIVATGDVRL
jgi:diaminopimelate epimerase